MTKSRSSRVAHLFVRSIWIGRRGCENKDESLYERTGIGGHACCERSPSSCSRWRQLRSCRETFPPCKPLKRPETRSCSGRTRTVAGGDVQRREIPPGERTRSGRLPPQENGISTPAQAAARSRASRSGSCAHAPALA